MPENNIIKFIRFPVGRLAEVIKMSKENQGMYENYFDLNTNLFTMPFLDNVIVFSKSLEKDKTELPFNRILTDVLGDVKISKDNENPFAGKQVAHSQPFFGDIVMCAVKDGKITTMSEWQLRKYMMLNGLPQGIADFGNNQATIFTYKPIKNDPDSDDAD